MPQLSPGTRVDRYVVEERLGAGGMGEVWRAKHVSLQSRVVIKVLHPGRGIDEATMQRFLREARTAAAAGSPHITAVTDFAVSSEGVPFLVMEHLEGCDLSQLLAATGKLSVERACEIALQVLEGLAAAHRAGIVHRDIKPANVFLTRRTDGSPGDWVKLLDFGISKVIEGTSVEVLTRTGVLMGTPLYMAPEQFMDAREVDARADLYSVSVLLYEMLSGALPHDANSLQEIIVQVLKHPPRPLARVAPDVPRALVEVVERGLASDPDARWQSANELAAAIRGTLSAQPTVPETRHVAVAHTLPVSTAPPASEWKSWTASQVKPPEPPAQSTVGSSKGLWVAGSASLLALFVVYCLPTIVVVLIFAALVGYQLWRLP